MDNAFSVEVDEENVRKLVHQDMGHLNPSHNGVVVLGLQHCGYVAGERGRRGEGGREEGRRGEGRGEREGGRKGGGRRGEGRGREEGREGGGRGEGGKKEREGGGNRKWIEYEVPYFTLYTHLDTGISLSMSLSMSALEKEEEGGREGGREGRREEDSEVRRKDGLRTEEHTQHDRGDAEWFSSTCYEQKSQPEWAVRY